LKERTRVTKLPVDEWMTTVATKRGELATRTQRFKKQITLKLNQLLSRLQKDTHAFNTQIKTLKNVSSGLIFKLLSTQKGRYR
jgi:hypothetical protein